MIDYSAEASALGYIYQVRYALYKLLGLGHDDKIILESLDDIAFMNGSAVTNLAQLKHHITRKASLTNTCPDVWKSIRVWSDYLTNHCDEDLPILNLVTTGSAPVGSAAGFLKLQNRDSSKAVNILKSAASTSQNVALKDCFYKFNLLSDTQKEYLVSQIYVLDMSPTILDVVGLIKKEVKYAVRPEHIGSFYERLEGWWFDKVIQSLSGQLLEPISGIEVHYKISDIAKQFEPDALPIDFLEAEPATALDPLNDPRLFVKQLQEIHIAPRRIENAIRDYYRAFEQRSRWAREDLLVDREIELYEKKLVNEWERFGLAISDDYGVDEKNNQILEEIGRKIYSWMEMTAFFPIRSNCKESYVMRGSYQMLADTYPPRVWWHPKFVERVALVIGGRTVNE